MKQSFLLSFLLFSPSLITVPLYSADDYNDSLLDSAIEHERELKFTHFDDIILRNSHEDIQELPGILGDQSRLKYYPYPCVSLVGKPGTYKTSIVSAIANKAGWKVEPINSATLGKGTRNASTEIFTGIIERLKKEECPTIVLLDEMNVMVQNYQSEHHDSDMLARAMWGIMDDIKYKGPGHIFFMATMNEFDKIPEPFKTRLFATKVDVDEFKDPGVIKELFWEQMNDENFIIPEEVRTTIDHELATIDLTNPRFMDFCARTIKTKALCGSSIPVVLSSDGALRAISSYKSKFQAISFKDNAESEQMQIYKMQRFDDRIKFSISTTLSVAGLGLSAWQMMRSAEQFDKSHAVACFGAGISVMGLLQSARQFFISQETSKDQFAQSHKLAQSQLTQSQEQFAESHRLAQLNTGISTFSARQSHEYTSGRANGSYSDSDVQSVLSEAQKTVKKIEQMEK